MGILKAILLTLVLIVIFSLAKVVLSFLFFDIEFIRDSFQNHYGITTVVSFVVAYLVVFKLFWKQELNFKDSLDFKNLDFKFLSYLSLITIGIQLLDRPFIDFGRIWSFLNHSEFETDFKSFKGYSSQFLYYSVQTLIIAPVFEELFFRKFLLMKLFEKNSKVVAILISSFCFALIHLESPFNLIPAFMFGIVSGLIYIKTKKISYSIFLHFLINLFALAFYILDFPFDRWLLSLNFNYYYWLFFLAGIGITFFGTNHLLRLKNT